MPKIITPSSYNFKTTQFENACLFCEFTTNSDTAIKLHMKFVHKKITKKDDVTHICANCSEKFKTKEELGKHIKKHVLKTKGNKK